APAVLDRAPVDRHVLAEGVAVADHERGRFARVLLVLRRPADRTERMEDVVAADRRARGDHAVRSDRRVGADANVALDDRVGADANGAVELRARIDDGGRVDQGCAAHSSSTPLARSPSRSVHLSSASAVVCPSTLARPWYFQIGRATRVISTSSRSWSPGTTGRLKRALSMPTK